MLFLPLPFPLFPRLLILLELSLLVQLSFYAFVIPGSIGDLAFIS